jgi:hypothetical protein
MNSEEKLALPSLDAVIKPTAVPRVTYLQLIMKFLLQNKRLLCRKPEREKIY